MALQYFGPLVLTPDVGQPLREVFSPSHHCAELKGSYWATPNTEPNQGNPVNNKLFNLSEEVAAVIGGTDALGGAMGLADVERYGCCHGMKH